VDLIEFLTARYDEAAEDATSFHRSDCAEVGYTVIPDTACDCGHPARILADIAAKRGLLALHKVNVNVEGPPPRYRDPGTNYQEGRITYWCDECDHDRDYGHIGGPDEGCRTLRWLAAPYAEHPDYDPAWAVS
jgi:hypothetical protein